MSVVPLKPGQPEGDVIREEFIAHLAQCYDKLVSEGHKPDGFVFVLSQLKGVSETHWVLRGDAMEAISPSLARASFALNRAINKAADGW